MKTRSEKTKLFIYKTLSAMSIGLFASLIIGTIFSQFGLLIGKNTLGILLNNGVGRLLKSLTGVLIGASVAIVLKYDMLKTVSLAGCGGIASSFKIDLTSSQFYKPILELNICPLTIYLVVIVVAVLLNLILKKKTAIDILLIPFLAILLAIIFTYMISGPITLFIKYLSLYISLLTKEIPPVMVILISIIMGIILTSPISSAAISYIITIGINPLAALAATIGTCTQMVGFSIQSRKGNKVGIMLSIFFGTSMLQFKNIVKKPIIWLPTIISSGLIAPLLLFFNFDLANNIQTINTLFNTNLLYASINPNIIQALTLAAGMGTSGLVAPFQVLLAFSFSGEALLFVVLCLLVIPFYLVYLIDFLFIKTNLYKREDLKV